MRLVCIESPYAGDVLANEAYARACMADCLRRGEAPYASHALYTQPGVLDDAIPAERRMGMEAGFAWGEVAAARVVYTDRGISLGMAEAIVLAVQRGQPIEYRTMPAVVEQPALMAASDSLETVLNAWDDRTEPEPLTLRLRVKAEAYDYRIYEMEMAYMMQLAGTPGSDEAKAQMERVTANYHRDYPDRPLQPKRDPRLPAPEGSPYWPYTAEKKSRKPYTRKAKAA